MTKPQPTMVNDLMSALSAQNFAAAYKHLSAATSKTCPGAPQTTAEGTSVNVAGVFLNQARLALRLGFNKKAITAAKAAIEAGGPPAACQLYLGLAQHAMGNLDAACAAWASAKASVDESTPIDTTLRILAVCDDAKVAQWLRETDLKLPGGAYEPTGEVHPVQAQDKRMVSPPQQSTRCRPQHNPAQLSTTVSANPPTSSDSTPQLVSTSAVAISEGDGAGSSIVPGEILGGGTKMETAKSTSASSSNHETRQLPSESVAGYGPHMMSLMSPDAALQEAIARVNARELDAGEQLLDYVIPRTAQPYGPYLTRGTARALSGRLQLAVEDFNAAVAASRTLEAALPPDARAHFADVYIRRAKATGALGETQAALRDLEEALSRLPARDIARGPALCDRGQLYIAQQDFTRAVKSLEAAAELLPGNVEVRQQLGQARVGLGDLEGGLAAYDAALKLDPTHRAALLCKAQALKEAARPDDAMAAFRAVFPAGGRGGQVDTTALHVWRVMAQMRWWQGRHAQSAALLLELLERAPREQVVETWYQLGVCWHGLGMLERAKAAYSRAVEVGSQVGEDDIAAAAKSETIQSGVMAYYQKDLCTMLQACLDLPVHTFCLERSFPDFFLLAWCKKAPPDPAFARDYAAFVGSARLQPAQPLPEPDWRSLKALLTTADSLGAVLLYRHQVEAGQRQLRAAGLAAVELAQKLHALLAPRIYKEAAATQHAPGAGTSSRREASSVSGEGSSGKGFAPHVFGWRDAMDLMVKWRQVAEPTDQVVWVDMLTKAEFNEGFGSHTPMYTGQTRVARYFSNFPRALALFRAVLKAGGRLYSAEGAEIKVTEELMEALAAATTVPQAWATVGCDSWLVVPVASTAVEGRILDGTRLTLVKLREAQQPDAYEFAIRTPVTPPRWAQFDWELVVAWRGLEATLEALLQLSHPAPQENRPPNGPGSNQFLDTDEDATHQSTSAENLESSNRAVPGDEAHVGPAPSGAITSIRAPGKVGKRANEPAEAARRSLQAAFAVAALRYVYYWFTFMPIARGTAGVGFATLVGLLYAGGMPAAQPVPPGRQLDWEAILARHPHEFIAAVAPWVLPSELIDAVLRLAPLPAKAVADSHSHGLGRDGGGCDSLPVPEGPQGAAGGQLLGPEVLPHVAEVLGTLRRRFQALNMLEADASLLMVG